VKLGDIDVITLDVKGTVVERLDVVAEPLGADEDEAEDEPVAGPIAIAVDVNDTEEVATAAADNRLK
jgi:exoribonuclease-2